MISFSKKSISSALNHSFSQRRMGNAVVKRLLEEIVFCVSIEQAADMLSLSRATVYKMIDRGEFAPIVSFGKRRVVPLEQFRAWLNARIEEQLSS